MKNSIVLMAFAVILLCATPVMAITINGNFDDWAGITGISDSTADGGYNDWKGFKASHDDNKLFLSYETEGIAGITSYPWIFQTYLDTDRNATTGYTGSELGGRVGAEYLLQGADLYRFDGWWNPQGTQSFGQNGGQTLTEIGMLRSTIGNPNAIDIALRINDSTVDWIPDSGHTTYVVPEPASLLLLGSGLIGLIGFVRKRK